MMTYRTISKKIKVKIGGLNYYAERVALRN